MTLAEFVVQFLPLLQDKSMKRIDQDCEEGKVTAYTMGDVVRIDIKPK